MSADAMVDITKEVCPMTFVRVKLALERLHRGQTLEVLLKGEEPWRNVPRSLREEGHEIVDESAAEGRLVVKKC